MELIQFIAPGVVFAASIIPLCFAIKIRNESQRILSALLFIALLAYGIHSLLESFEVLSYDIFVRLCFIVSASGLMVAYSFLQLKKFARAHWRNIWDRNDGFIRSVDDR